MLDHYPLPHSLVDRNDCIPILTEPEAMLLLAYAVIMQHSDCEDTNRQARRYTRGDPILIAQIDTRSPFFQIPSEPEPHRRQVVVCGSSKSRNRGVVLDRSCGSRDD